MNSTDEQNAIIWLTKIIMSYSKTKLYFLKKFISLNKHNACDFCRLFQSYFILISIILRNVFYSAPKTVVHRATKYICIIFENTSGSPCFLIFLTSLSWHTFSPMLYSNWKYYFATLVFFLFSFLRTESGILFL